MLFTGDEMGWMIKWDISSLVDKLEQLSPEKLEEQKNAAEAEGQTVGNMKKVISKKSTFLTSFNEEVNKIQFSSDDVKVVQVPDEIEIDEETEERTIKSWKPLRK